MGSRITRQARIFRLVLGLVTLLCFTTQTRAYVAAQGEGNEPPISPEQGSEEDYVANPSFSLPQISPNIPTVELCQLDLVFVADGSGSISSTDFSRIKQFIKSFLSSLNVGPSKTSVGLVQFSSQGQGKIEQSLTDSLDAINGAVDRMAQLDGSTDIQEGISLAANELTNRGRSNMPRVIVLLTDGAHNQPGDPQTEAQSFKQAGGFIFSIAVGSSVNRNELIGISSQPYTRYYYSVTDANSLAGILNSLAENVCSCRETRTANERVTRVADGLCLRVYDDNIYVGSANLANPNVRIKSVHEFSDQTQGLFVKKSLKQHVREDTDIAVLTCVPSAVFPVIGPVCYRTPTQYYFAINGTAHTQDFKSPDRPSQDSILAINGQLYRETGLGVIDKPRASFFTLFGATGSIHRAYTDIAAPLPSFSIPISIDAPISDYALARDYVQQATIGAKIAVGYRPTILDLSVTPPLIGGNIETSSFSQLTAIAVSADGNTVYLATAKEGVGPVNLAMKLKAVGANRAVLLDGSSSTQFASFRENYSSLFPDISLARPIVNGIVAYSISGTVNSLIAAASNTQQAIAPNTTINIRSGSLASGVLISQTPIILSNQAAQSVDNLTYSEASSNTIELTPTLNILPPGNPLKNTGLAYVLYAQTRAGAVVQPQNGYAITVTFDLLDFPPGVSANMLSIYFWDGTNWKRESTSKVNIRSQSITAQPKQFGVWSIFADPRIWMPIITKGI